MLFYHHARVDGLVKREETPQEMKEYYEEREDFLYSRQVEFAKRPRKLEPASGKSSSGPRPIVVSQFFCLCSLYPIA